MCLACSAFKIPVCGSGFFCAGSFHEAISFALLAGSGLVGSIVGYLHKENKQGKNDKKI